MIYEPESEDARIARNLARAPEREKMLLAQAERLIAARAAKLGVPAKTVVNALFSEEPEPPPTPEDDEKAGIVAQLVRRLATRDELGGGSGEAG